MKRIRLVKPKIKDLWFRRDCMADPLTMAYNAGYDVSYDGYHYDTGCIDFPEESWEEWYNTKMKNPNFFYAYIQDEDTADFVGYVNFNKNPQSGSATMGVVVKSDYHGMGYMRPAMEALLIEAERSGVKVLTDTVPETRDHALKVFYSYGFEKVGEFVGLKFGKEETVAEIQREI